MLLCGVVPKFFTDTVMVSCAVSPQPETGEIMLVTPASVGNAEGTVRTEIPKTFKTPPVLVLLNVTLCTVFPHWPPINLANTGINADW